MPGFARPSGSNAERRRFITARSVSPNIKGIAHADSQVGPPLDEIRKRGYIAGVMPHTADNLVKWIRHPRQVVPNTAMPELGVSEAEARDMAAYLYSQ